LQKKKTLIYTPWISVGVVLVALDGEELGVDGVREDSVGQEPARKLVHGADLRRLRADPKDRPVVAVLVLLDALAFLVHFVDLTEKRAERIIPTDRAFGFFVHAEHGS